MPDRIALLGRGAAGKSTLARELARRHGLPLIELDRLFWTPDARPMGPDRWERTHAAVIAGHRWVVDGDLGRYDSGLVARLAAADAVIVLDFPLWLCAWRSLRRSRETGEYWLWLIRYRRRSLPVIRSAVNRAGAANRTRWLRRPAEVADLPGNL